MRTGPLGPTVNVAVLVPTGAPVPVVFQFYNVGFLVFINATFHNISVISQLYINFRINDAIKIGFT
jgi:hypothetical protein